MVRGGVKAVLANDFRSACARFTTGVTVATVFAQDGTPQGLTASSFTSVSLEPPLVSLCVAHSSNTHAAFRTAKTMAVHILGEEQQELSVRFAMWDPGERFEGLDWKVGDFGAPVIAGALACLQCTIWKKVEAGDHTIVLGNVRQAAWRDGLPLVYFDRGYRKVGEF